jgi:hypothetical protein
MQQRKYVGLSDKMDKAQINGYLKKTSEVFILAGFILYIYI